MTDFTTTGNPSEAIPEAQSFVAPAVQGEDAVLLELQGRKYTRSDLEKKILHADSFIDNLKKELADQRALLGEVNDTLRQQVNAREVLEQLSANKPIEAPAAAQPNTPNSAPTVDSLTASVMATLRTQEEAKSANANWESVTKTLSLAYGDSVNQRVVDVAAEVGMTLEEAASLARAKPQAFLRLFPDLKPSAKGSGIGRGSVNTLALSTNTPAPTKSGYMQATKTRDSVNVYLARLNQAG